MPIVDGDRLRSHYDLVIAGSGFGALFFLYGYLARFPKSTCLVVEWGGHHDQAWQVANQRNSDIDHNTTFAKRRNEKPWYFTIGLGGGTNCWWGQTPRFAPNDFRLKSKYGVGMDWPVSYDDVEPYYVAAEQIMLVAGADDTAKVYPRSAPYPQPAHRLSSVDRVMKAAMPDHHFAAPTARLSQPVDGRSACCNTVNCSFCPMEAKFTALNTFGSLFASPKVDILLNSKVLAVETAAGKAQGLRFSLNGRERVAKSDLVAVGCNAIHTPFILMRSGLQHPALGRYLHEKRVLIFEVLLDGLDNFDGGAPIAGVNTLWVDGEHRRNSAAASGHTPGANRTGSFD